MNSWPAVLRRGLLLNPLGNPLEMDWDTMAAARFQRQSNQDELVAAMAAYPRDPASDCCPTGLSRRMPPKQFNGFLCLRRHAGVLK